MLDIFIFAAIAVAVIWRLSRTLGQVGSENDRIISAPYEVLHTRAEEEAIQKEEEALAFLENSMSPQVRQVYEVLQESIPNFNVNTFLSGAKKAYEMIVIAAAKGDTKTLQALLTPDLHKKYMQRFADLVQQQYTHQCIFIGIDVAEIVDAQIAEKNIAVLTVLFQSEQVNAILDKNGNIVTGDTKKVQKLQHKWVFTRSLDSGTTLWCVADSDL